MCASEFSIWKASVEKPLSETTIKHYCRSIKHTSEINFRPKRKLRFGFPLHQSPVSYRYPNFDWAIPLTFTGTYNWNISGNILRLTEIKELSQPANQFTIPLDVIQTKRTDLQRLSLPNYSNELAGERMNHSIPNVLVSSIAYNILTNSLS